MTSVMLKGQFTSSFTHPLVPNQYEG